MTTAVSEGDFNGFCKPREQNQQTSKMPRHEEARASFWNRQHGQSKQEGERSKGLTLGSRIDSDWLSADEKP